MIGGDHLYDMVHAVTTPHLVSEQCNNDYLGAPFSDDAGNSFIVSLLGQKIRMRTFRTRTATPTKRYPQRS
jgi:hypothetical protein